MLVYPIDKDLFLRLPREECLEEAFALVKQNTDHLRTWLPWVTDEFSIEDARAFVRNNLQNFAENKGFALHVVFQGRIVGNVGYNTIDWSNRKCEIGYWLISNAQGQGLMTRACSAMVDHAFDRLKLNRLEIHCGTENKRSRLIPERLGFKLEAVLREAEWLHDRFHDLAVYSKLASERE